MASTWAEPDSDTSAQPQRVPALLDALLANSSTAIVTIDDVGTIRYFSAGASLLLGCDAESTVGTSVFTFLHEDDVSDAAQLLVRRIEYEGADMGHEMRLRHSSGHWITVEVTASGLPDETLGVAALTLRAKDASANREHSLRRKLVVEEFCNKLSADFMDATTSAAVLDRLEQSLEEVALLTGAEIVSVFLERHELDILERLARWVVPSRSIGSGMETVDIDLDREAIEGALTQVHVADSLAESLLWSRSPLTSSMDASALLSAPFVTGNQRGALVLTRVDPGPTWFEADAQLARNVAKLYGRALHNARTEELLALTYREAPIGFSIRTWDGALVDCNQQYLDLQGLTRAEAEVTRLSAFIHRDDRDWVAERVKQLRNGERARLRHEMRVVQPDDTYRWVRVNAVPLQTSRARPRPSSLHPSRT